MIKSKKINHSVKAARMEEMTNTSWSFVVKGLMRKDQLKHPA
jgi:hypothetical protein